MEEVTVLVIEDNQEMCENISCILQLKNYQVITAHDGQEGLDLALQKKPDLVICDIKMPKLDGFGVLRALKSRPSTACIPFIFLTAKAQKIDLAKGADMGVDEYIVKPFDGKALLDVLETYLETYLK